MIEGSQSRKYLLTINNPQEQGINHDFINNACTDLILDYYCMSDEIATTGTKHTHIFLYRQSPIRFGTIKNKFPTAHIDKAYGTCQENKDYVAKIGKWKESMKSETSIEGTFEEHGIMPTEQSEKAPLMTQLLSSIENGDTTAEIIKNNPKFGFKVKDIDVLRETLLSEKFSKENRDITVTYLYGDTGTGKTRSLYEKYSPIDICRITNYKGDKVNFDSYHGQNVLVFEEFHSQIPLPDMLSYLDRYPLMLPARYSDRVACYTHVYLISNLSLMEQYHYEYMNDKKTWDAFLRRIDIIIHQIAPNNQLLVKKEELLNDSTRNNKFIPFNKN